MGMGHTLAVGVKYPRRALVDLYSRYVDLCGGIDGVDVVEADWDTLIILDGCRFDLFESINTLPGELRAVTSQSTHTGEFMEKNFRGGSFDDIVYVSANPRPSQYDASFHDVIFLWDSEWDSELNTVPPETVTEAAIEAHEQYPNKRILVHYLQPHYPFIGERGRDFHDEYGYTSLENQDNLWMRLRDGARDPERVWEIYEENLEVTLPHVQRLLDAIEGRVVVSSDHGNAFGEWDIWGHPGKAYIEPLLEVPWLVHEEGDRRTIEAGSATKQTERDSQAAKDRLKELGYVD